ncbi:MAG: FimB/Mfa2 family fimbrial subunit [Prevotella sp.]|nr:FimB/Mfa2 family fimbrial subunit [Prevotella sp.]
MRTKTKLALICMTSWTLGACEKELVSDNIVATDSSVSVITRSVTAEETISFPVALYVFNAEDHSFVKDVTVPDKDTPLTFSIPLGSYDIYAVGGADEVRYDYPSGENLDAESEMTLKDGKEHADLMTAHEVITLEEKDDYELTLNMERQVIELTSAVVNNIPDDITEVHILLSPIYKSIKINGDYGTIWTHSYPLTDSGEGRWTLPSPVMMLFDADAEDASITISLTKDDGTHKNYSYSLTEDIRKNHQISINATYQYDNSINITGSINGTTWSGSEEIVFNFGDESTTDDPNGNDDDTLINEPIPSVGNIYKECYVLKTTPNTEEGYNEVLLLYKNDFEINPTNKTEEQVLQEINDQLSTLTINGISGWRLPNEEELNLIYKQQGVIKQKIEITVDNIAHYYCYSDNRLKLCKEHETRNFQNDIGGKYIPVTTLKFKQQ